MPISDIDFGGGFGIDDIPKSIEVEQEGQSTPMVGICDFPKPGIRAILCLCRFHQSRFYLLLWLSSLLVVMIFLVFHPAIRQVRSVFEVEPFQDLAKHDEVLVVGLDGLGRVLLVLADYVYLVLPWSVLESLDEDVTAQGKDIYPVS